MIWFVLACADPDVDLDSDVDVVDTDDADDTDDTDAPDDTAVDPTASGCADGPWPEEVLGDGSVRVTTDHYVLTVDAIADPQDYARLVEAAYAAWTEDFGAAPDGGPLELQLYPTYDAWVAGLAARGIAAPAGAGGYYDPGTRLASLYRQPTLYFTEMLWLHEAFHQFHLLTRTGGPLPTWYVEGMAEWSSRHDWDGRCVRVGADPLATWEDAWSQADVDADLPGWVAGDRFPGRPEMMAFVHYMADEQAPRWGDFRDAVDFGSGATLDPAGLEAGFANHVRKNQEPLQPLWLDWVHRSPTTMRGVSGGALSAVRWKAAPARLEVDVPVVADAYAGGLVGWSAEGFDVVFVDGGGGLSRWTFTPDRNDWFSIGAVADPGKTVRWVQTASGLTLNGQAVPIAPVLPAAAGHAIYGATADFVTVAAE